MARTNPEILEPDRKQTKSSSPKYHDSEHHILNKSQGKILKN